MGILIQNKVFFLISKDFRMNMDTVPLSSLFSIVINSINVAVFNLVQYYGLIHVFLVHYTKNL